MQTNFRTLGQWEKIIKHVGRHLNNCERLLQIFRLLHLWV